MRTEKFNLCKSTKKLLTLITLLTLGVGQMWGAISYSGGYIYFDNSLGINSTTLQLCARQDKGGGSYWTAVSSLTNISNTKLYYVADPQGSGWGGIIGWVVISANPAKSNSDFDNWSSYTWCSDWNTYGFNSGSTYLIVPSSTSKSQSVTTSYYSGGYSGLNSTQTINTVVKVGSGSYSSANSKATISITSYALTGNGSVTKQTTSISTSAKTQTVSAARTATTTLSVGDVASGYQFDGWYTAATGGTQLSSSTTYTYYPTAATTVYARFSEKMSTVTLTASPAGKGTFTIGGAAATSTTAGVTTTRSVTAVPISGYHFVSWSITGGASISSTTTNPTTVTGGGAGTAATLTATFAADDVYSLTVAAGTGISAVTGSTNDIKAAQNIAITATVATGYTWNTWTKTGAGTLSTFTAGTKNQTVTVGTAGDITLTASATEIMRTITIDGGTSASTTAGVVTKGTATAAAPAAGKKFTGWSLGDGVSLADGYALTDRTIKFTATQASSVTANYADRAGVKMYFAKPTTLSWSKVYAYAWKSSDGSVKNANYPGIELENTETINCVVYYTYQYYTEGDGIGGAATGNSAWDRIVFGDNNDDRKTGDLTISNGHYYYRNSSGTGKAAAITSAWYIKGTMNSWGETNPITHNCATNSGSVDISLTTGTTWEFKVYNEVNHQMWSNSTACGQGDGITATMASAETLYNNDDNVMKITPALNGTYTFTVGSTNASNPTIKVAFPEIYAIAGSFNSWSTEANPLSMDGNTGTADIVLAPSGSNYTLKVVDDGAMYGKNSTTITGTTTVSGLVVGQNDIALTADIYPASANPSYSFSYNKSTKALTVTYPAAHTVTYGVGTHAGTTSVTSSISVASGKKILDSQSITFSKGDTKTGYTWKGWYNNTSGSSSALGTDATYTSSSRAANTSVYACYNLVTYTITYNLNGGSNPVSPAPATSFTIESAAITLPTPSKTGYTFAGWYENADLSTGGVKTTIPAGSTGNKVYYAKWTPITYSIHFNGNGSTSGSMDNQTGITYDAATNITTNAFVKTGYNFAGWALSSDGSVVRADGADHGNLTSTNGATVQLYAKWTPKTCTVNFDFDSSDPGHGSHTSATTSTSATYDAAMTSVTPPTAATGYAFMGYFTGADGAGTQYYDGSGNSAANWAVDTEEETTLYAYYKKAEITGITFSPRTTIEPGATVTVTPTISPTPVDPVIVCWRVLYNNDNPLSPQPTFTPVSGNTVSFPAHEASGTYKLEATLRTGAACGSGTVLDTYVATFHVAGDHTVTILYQDASGNTIKASESVIASAIDYTDFDITAPDIFGYTFSQWHAYDGVKIKDSDSDEKDESEIQTIKIRAIYDGRLVATYNQKSMIYFKNTLNWENVYVNFYTDSYWNNPLGSGNQGVTNKNLTMTQYGESDIWYYDYGASSISPSLYVSFTSESQNNYNNFYGTSVVYPAHYYQDEIHNNHVSENGFKAATPMFVPLAGQTKTTLNTTADYYNRGYWTKYTPGTGYVLEIYNTAENALIKSIEFTSENDLMPMKAVADLEAGVHYKYQIRRGGTGVNGCYLGTSKTGDDVYMSYTDHTAWQLSNSSFHMLGVITTAAGNYTFTLTYANTGSNDDHRFRITVDYPASAGDFQILYNDRANWSQSAAHSATWIHPSRVITARPNGVDTISFYVYKNANTALTARQVSSINASTGAITWAAANIGASASMSLSGVAATGVYNFVVTQNAAGTAISSIENIGEYTGNYYIRTDAANSKWDNYTTDGDHLMTYSEYSITHGGYSHYYCHWVKYTDTGRKNVKFCIANDYSPCISDTLAREEATGTWEHIEDFMEEGGDLKRDANVRYMWNIATNKLSRAYVDGAQEDGSEFLLMLNTDATDMIRWADESALTDKKVTFSDNENWIYEADIQAKPNAQIRLKSTWGETNVIEQYFKGSSSTSETLIGGSGSTWYDIRLLYDFKTNRLVAAYKPSGNITDETAINADIMFIREHQGDISQLTFSGSGTITDIKTAYGVIRFNKWILNNMEPSGNTHPVLAEPKSLYERSLFWISFPFRVKLSEVFGFGTYGSHWAIQYYDGADRAARGHFLENGTFWKWLNRSTAYLEPNQGYLLAIDVDLLGINSDVWGPESRSEQIELYFPSTGTMPNLTSADVVQTIPEHTCSINRAASEGLPDTGDPRTSYNRTIFDSHWNVLSVPTYVNTDDVTFANTTWTTEGSGKRGPNFLYTWNSDDNTITATAARGYTYHAMHSYMVQYYDEVTWSASSGSPYPIVARKTYEEAPREIEFRLEIQQNEKMIDRTYVVLSNDEEVSANFAFGEDMVKEFNARKAAIFNYTADNVGVAGNTMPMSEQTTVIPVGLEIPTAGEYTFAIPDGTEGVGVILVDNVANTRTNLSALDYTVNLTTGTHDGRFVLEISPIHNATTGIEAVSDEELEITGARKMIIDQKLYIVKDGKLFDATGKRVE